MKIYARGWRRNHGAKEVAVGDVSVAIRDDGLHGYRFDETYVQLLRPARYSGDFAVEELDALQGGVRVLMSSVPQVNLNGRYQFQTDVMKRDIAEMFYLTHASDSLDEIVRILNERAKR